MIQQNKSTLNIHSH